MSLLLRNVEVEGRVVDVRVARGRIAEIGRSLVGKASVIDGAGGALLPGLHDHHLHLLALAAAVRSIDCGAGLEALRNADSEWVRGVNFDGSVDRFALDEVVRDRPVRVQHRGGALWMLNTVALARVRHVLDHSPDVERDSTGQPTGRLWRYDDRLRAALPPVVPDLAHVTARLHSFGITRVTDATPDLDDRALDLLRGVDVLVTALGDPNSTAPRKLLLRDHDLPTYDDLAESIGTWHRTGRPVAVHCVTRDSLLLTLAVLDQVGSIAGDRIEHAAVVPPEATVAMARLGLSVVTQPDLLRTRGETYLREVATDDLALLYPFASLVEAGVPTIASSDAPFGELDPWQVMKSSAERLTAAGNLLNGAERVPTSVALDGYLRDGAGRRRRVHVGASADLCLLHVPLDDALRSPDASLVNLTIPSDRKFRRTMLNIL